MKIFTLFCQELSGDWNPRFSDFDKRLVLIEERNEYVENYPVERRVILKMEDTEDAFYHAQRSLEKHGRNIRV